MTNTNTRSISTIAAEIMADWRNVNYAAQPYLNAMLGMDKITDNYGMDSGRSVVSYFLVNAGGWRGETAKRVKAELKKMVAAR